MIASRPCWTQSCSLPHGTGSCWDSRGLSAATSHPRAVPGGTDTRSQPHPQCTAQGGPIGGTPGPEVLREAPVAGIILPRTYWLLPQRCFRGVLIILPCRSRRAETVRDSGDDNQGPTKKCNSERRAPGTGASHCLWHNLAPVQAAGPHCTRTGVALRAG